ncbi:MAG TPA: endonuclease MutS2, partial [Lentimicrobium sp.]|nr:endonuclease MutS2 [Lentimicrobium sp.]
MIYPDTFEAKTGFTQIRQMMQSLCLSNRGAQLVAGMEFTGDHQEIVRRTGELSEMQYILKFAGNFPSQDYYDLTEMLLHLRLPGTYADPEYLSELRLSLITITEIVRYLNRLDEVQFPNLRAIAPEEVPDPVIVKRIEQIVDDKSEIRDKASEHLYSIRREISSRISGVDRRITRILASARKEGIAQDDAELTIRNGRLVIPLPASNKRKLQGYVHDTSATGHTVFVEPAEVFEINNEIQNLRVEEKQEITRILIDFGDFIRPFTTELAEYYSFLGKVDFIRAGAMLAVNMGAAKPEINVGPVMDWRNAVHPLLNLALKQQGRKIVPQDIRLTQDQRIMVISGPNAGGKSVCLKTAALLQYMLQCGLLIPVSEDSVAGVFSRIFLEIGDEQSLENDLSTYSSHLIHIRNFIGNANSSSLIFIDEFGAGTEPQLGGAMAEASLEALNGSGCFGIITTHYTNLKLMADRLPGIFNAAMLYDTRAMQPLFKLSPGKPGSSFAFEIAQKIGFPVQVLENAKTKISRTQLDFELQLAQLEVDKRNIEQKKAELKVADETLASLVGRYETQLNQLETKRQDLLRDARLQARAIIDKSNKLIENTIKEIREQKADKKATREVREKLAETAGAILNEDFEPAAPTPPSLKGEKEPVKRPEGPIRPGSLVKM